MQEATRAQLCLTRLCEVPHRSCCSSCPLLCCAPRAAERGSPEVSPWPGGEESDYDKAYGYLRRHAEWMDYSRYCRLRTPIGSGVTEAACKIVFTQRFKRAGMKWNIEGGQPILDLRVIAPSNLWSTTRTSDAGSQQRMTSLNTTPTGREPLQNC